MGLMCIPCLRVASFGWCVGFSTLYLSNNITQEEQTCHVLTCFTLKLLMLAFGTTTCLLKYNQFILFILLVFPKHFSLKDFGLVAKNSRI